MRRLPRGPTGLLFRALERKFIKFPRAEAGLGARADGLACAKRCLHALEGNDMNIGEGRSLILEHIGLFLEMRCRGAG
jgi:hypothetical protein